MTKDKRKMAKLLSTMERCRKRAHSLAMKNRNDEYESNFYMELATETCFSGLGYVGAALVDEYQCYLDKPQFLGGGLKNDCLQGGEDKEEGA